MTDEVVQISLRIPRSVLEAVDAAAAADRRSRNEWLVMRAEGAVMAAEVSPGPPADSLPIEMRTPRRGDNYDVELISKGGMVFWRVPSLALGGYEQLRGLARDAAHKAIAARVGHKDFKLTEVAES